MKGHQVPRHREHEGPARCRSGQVTLGADRELEGGRVLVGAGGGERRARGTDHGMSWDAAGEAGSSVGPGQRLRS